ncbi:amidohydrolase [Agrococcus versicolor]|uniref:Amidohydrolase n=2 Tax=Agrococcus versicolor TaxID=501482 RepID=A0ABN3AK73_9MICO
MPSPAADTILTNANVVTMDPRRPHAEAIAIRGGRVLAVADAAAMTDLVGDVTEVRDLRGRTVTPGLIDAHLHPIQGLDLAAGCDLAGIVTADALLRALRAEADRVVGDDDPWVRAWNLDYDVFHDLPRTAAAIDDAVRGLPALIVLFDGHTALASTEALRRTGIDRAIAFADTAEVVVDADGRPTGELREMSAFWPVIDAAPAWLRQERLDRARTLLAGLGASGLTGGCIMDGTASDLDLLSDLDALGLPVRIVTAIDHQPGFDEARTQANIALRDRAGSRWRAGLVKLYADGVVETGTAWLYEPDSAGGGNTPFWGDVATYERTVRRYAEAGFQIATHAIGDRAIGSAIDAYLAVERPASGASHRIEHLETLADADLARLAAAGITASIQPLHMQWRKPDGSDDWSTRLGPERSARAWRAGDMLRAGVPLALGSDWPIAQSDARVGLAWAMLRRTPGDRDAFVFEPEQRLTAMQALHGATRGAALAQGDADLGILAPGTRADYAVWEESPLEVSPDDLVSLPVLETAIDGRPTSGPTA